MSEHQNARPQLPLGLARRGFTGVIQTSVLPHLDRSTEPTPVLKSLVQRCQ